MSSDHEIIKNNLKFIIPPIRFAGLLIFLFGTALLFNFVGLAEKMDLLKDGAHQVIGMMISIFGIIEFILTPRILESILDRKAKK